MSAKNPAAVVLGRKGGKATARKRTPQERSEAARKAVEARWARLRKLADEITKGTKALERAAARRKKARGRTTQKKH